MKTKINIINKLRFALWVVIISAFSLPAFSQETEETMVKAPKKYAKNTFESVWIIDNQTVMVPAKGTLEFDILHRFGTVKNGFDDLWGLFAPSNIRLGFAYAPINNLNLGLGLTKEKQIVDGSLKYAIIKQLKDSWKVPVSITYYGNMSYDLKKDPEGTEYKYETDRLRFFNQLIIASKITEKLSIQVAPSLSHQNFVQGFIKKVQIDSVKSENQVFAEMKHDHFALAFSGRYKVTNSMAIMVNYDQPITIHTANNPNPNLSFGLELGTSGHSFQIFAGNYYFLNPQRNNLFNTNNPVKYTDAANNKIAGGNFIIGFNITRLWSL